MPPPISFFALEKEFSGLFATCTIHKEFSGVVSSIVDKIVSYSDRYKAVTAGGPVPWWFVAVIHSLESSLNFKTHLHNGDPLTFRTTNTPKGRPSAPPASGKAYSWEESALDSIVYNGLLNWKVWTIPGCLYRLEAYNGWGYRIWHPEVKSPYLWSFSNHYSKGKFIADGRFDPNAVSRQAGGAVLIKEMIRTGVIQDFNKK